MDIRIKTMTIENFKGVRRLTLKFNGANILVEGDNGTGKSTIFDAFTWLMFGKDHNGNDQTHFDIKTIDPITLQPIERVDHSVEAELLVDGCSKKLKRIWRENWVKPKGRTEQVLKGHTSVFMVDDVDVATKKNYDDIISQWADESVFRLITDPLFFIGDSTPWKFRRDVLLGLVAGKVDRSELNHQFHDLLHEMNGDNMDTFRKRIAASKKESKKMLEETEAKISAWEESLPEIVNLAEVMSRRNDLAKAKEEELEIPRAEIAAIDGKIMDVNEANRGVNEMVSGYYKQITELQMKQEALVNDSIREIMERNAERAKDLRSKKDMVLSCEDEVNSLNRRIERLNDNLHAMQNDRAELTVSLRRLGKEYEDEKVRTFTYEATTKCHACGQELPAETIEEAYRNAREAYLKGQKETLNRIITKAQKVKDDIAAVDASIAKVADELEEKKKLLEGATQRAWDSVKAYDEAMKVPAADIEEEKKRARSGEEYRKMEDEIVTLREKALGAGRKDTTDVSAFDVAKRALYRDIDKIEAKYKDMEKELAALEAQHMVRKNMQKLIDDAEKKVKEMADAIARLENLEYEAVAYIKADVSAQEDALNSLFNVARWKMFDYTLEGGIVETCEVQTKTGASLTSMNDAAKIQCGMDVIRVLSNHNKTWATIFIDNAESITQKKFDTTAQVIRLKVKEGSELTVSAE